MKPFLSITIPTYNRVDCLKKAVGAILEQVGEDPQVELVISDNGSTDGTFAFGIDCAGRYPRVRYFRNEANEGFDTNVLACVQRAEGTYISFFSDDDLPAPRFFENVLKRLRDDRPTILYVNHTSFYNGNPACLGLPQAAVETFSTDDGKAFYMKCGLGFLSALTVYADTARQFTGKVVQKRVGAS